MASHLFLGKIIINGNYKKCYNYSMLKSKHLLYLSTLLIFSLVLLLVLSGPIKQDLNYHHFADHLDYFGIPNFHNVISNILFLIFPIFGFLNFKSNKESLGLSWPIFLLGVFLVSPGSAYYHYNPNDQTLFWDRLPMTFAFMALTSFAFN
mgnify:CR=1 FL=1